MRIANSGAPRPIFCRHAKTEVVQATGLPAGLFEDAQYEEVTISAVPGDLFVFFSDGIVDAVTPKGEQFGRARVERIVTSRCEASAAEVVESIFDAVEDHTKGLPAFDDETVVVLKVTANGAIAVGSKSKLERKS